MLIILIFYTEQVNSSGVMPIIFSTSSLALPGTLARFTGLDFLKKAAVGLVPGGMFTHLLKHVYVLALNSNYPLAVPHTKKKKNKKRRKD